MPRQAHGRSLQKLNPPKPSKRKPLKGRGLNALQIAESENPEQVKIRQHRLGESYDDPDESQNRADSDERSAKRRKVSGDDGEDSGSGSDLDGERWHVGVEEEDEDSDIDSDEAFGESDEEKFADFTFRGSQRNHSDRKSRADPRETDPDDVEAEDSEDDLGDEAVDLATALDMNERSESELQDKRKRRRQSPTPDASNDQDSDSDDHNTDSGDESDRISDLSISDQENGDHDKFQKFVQSLAKPKSKDTSTQQTSAPTKISASDLLQYIKDPQQRQSLKILQNNEVKAPEPYRGGIPGRLAAPLAKRQQDRLDRGAAYDESKKQLGKWVDTVKHNRRAEHLMFPLVDPSTAGALNNDQMAPISQSKSMSTLESKIQEILHESGQMGKSNRSADQDEQEFEELQERKLSLLEVQARRAELRKARDLMFREEIRAKRIKKIKSKAYRRVHRKERERLDFKERTELAADGLVDSEEEREKNDRRRAEERMGARHRESKWAKAVKMTGRATWDEDARDGVGDLARRDEELRRRVQGKDAKGSDFSESESESDGYDSEADDKVLQDRLDALNDAELDAPVSKLESMAFMKRADAAKKAANETEIRELRQQVRRENGLPANQSSDEEMPEGGRQKFGGKPVTKALQLVGQSIDKSEFEERLSDNEDAEQDVDIVTEPPPAANNPAGTTSNSASADQKVTARKSNKNTNPTPTAKSQSKLQSQQPKFILKQPTVHTKPQTILDSPPSDTDTDTNLTTPAAPAAPASPLHEPQSLSEAIFFGDDTLPSAFSAEKSADAAIDESFFNPSATNDTGLPGWGSWTGVGISKRSQKRSLAHSTTKTTTKTTNKSLLNSNAKQDPTRKDAHLPNVIISEKSSRKSAKYLATELPHPFETRAQYERAMRVPLGGEWRTKRDFQDGVKPRVLVRQGVIRAIGRPVV